MTLDDLEQWFKDNPPPRQVRLSRFEMIADSEKFIKNHILTLRNNTGNKTFMPYYDRLMKLKKVCENEHFSPASGGISRPPTY